MAPLFVILLSSACKIPSHMKKLYALIIAAFAVSVAVAQPAGWSYVLPFNVTNTTAALVTNYQLQLTVNTQAPIGAGQMNINGDDIRFGKDCAGTTLFNYWIESGINTTATTIWVKIDTLPASGSVQLFMYYGNAAATAASTIPGVFIGPHSATDSTVNTSLSGSADAQRGFRFAPTETVLATSFGKYTSSGNPRYVTLFDFNTQGVLRQVQVAGPANAFSYTSIQPIWMTQNTQYLLEIFCPSGDDSYYFGASPTVGQHIQYFDMRYCNGCTQNTFPTNSLGGMLYGYVDLWYWTKTNIASAPTVTVGSALNTVASSPATICMNDSTAISATVTGGAMPYTYSWSPAAGLSNTAIANPMASPSGTTTYTVTVTDGCGTTSQATASVTVNTLPAVTATVSDDSVCNGSSFIPTGGGAATYAWSGGLTDNVAFTPAFTDTYTVTGTDANGCTGTASATVEVLHTPAVTAAATATTVCEGDSVVFNGGGAMTYAWTNGVTDNMPYAPSATMTYVVTGTDMYGCEAMDSVTVTVNPLPVVSLSGVPAMVCDMDAALLLSGAPAGGTFAGPGVTGNSFDPSAATAGTHTLTYSYTDSLGCTAMDSVSVIVDLCLGLNETRTDGIHVFPNPFENSFVLQLDNPGRAHVRIVNSIGQVVFAQDMNAGRNEINTASFAAGVYSLEVVSAQGTSVIKLVKN